MKTNDVVLPTSHEREVRIRCITQTDESQRILLDRLGLKIPSRLGDPQWSASPPMQSKNTPKNGPDALSGGLVDAWLRNLG